MGCLLKYCYFIRREGESNEGQVHVVLLVLQVVCVQVDLLLNHVEVGGVVRTFHLG